jgi:subtilisin family serine protease
VPLKGFPIELREPMASYPRVIAVSNCWMPPDGKERLYRGEKDGAPSNYGDNITICADGYGSETVRSYCDPPKDECTVGGTSAAAATVTAVVALMLSANPKLKWHEVKRILQSTAERVDKDQSDPDGRYDENGRSKWYGTGRLNAKAAVQAALDAASPADH